MSDYEQIAIIVASISIVVSIVSAIFASLRWKASYQSAQVASANMYKSINDLVGKDAIFFGPLTPYGRESDEEVIQLRQFLLMRLNRFKFASGRKDRKEHVLFRQKAMGSSLNEFRDLLGERGASNEYADKAVRTLVSIKNVEPYFNSEFWKTYFSCFDWSVPQRSVS